MEHRRYLYHARISSHLSLEQIGLRTALSPSVLRNIDEGRFHLLPSGLYARSYVRAFAGAVGLDPEAALAEVESFLPGAPDPLALLSETKGSTPVERLAKRIANLAPRLPGIPPALKSPAAAVDCVRPAAAALLKWRAAIVHHVQERREDLPESASPAQAPDIWTLEDAWDQPRTRQDDPSCDGVLVDVRQFQEEALIWPESVFEVVEPSPEGVLNRIEPGTNGVPNGGESWPPAVLNRVGPWQTAASNRVESWPRTVLNRVRPWPRTVLNRVSPWPTTLSNHVEPWPKIVLNRGKEAWSRLPELVSHRELSPGLTRCGAAAIDAVLLLTVDAFLVLLISWSSGVRPTVLLREAGLAIGSFCAIPIALYFLLFGGIAGSTLGGYVCSLIQPSPDHPLSLHDILRRAVRR